MTRAVSFFLSILLSTFAVPSLAFETAARNAYVIDIGTGVTLLEKDSHTAMPPASTSKLMTIALLFKALRDGEVSLDTTFRVSAKAGAIGGSTMFLETGSDVRIEELIKGILIQSGNDACVTVAEGLSGTEDAFAQEMNAFATKLGLTDSSFGNASGWPDPKQRMSAYDLANLAYHLNTTYPEYWHYFGLPSFTYNNITQKNRNPLIGVIDGADGLKTGHTNESGYSVVGSVKRGDRRIIMVLMGMQTEAERESEALRVADWAFNEFNLETQYRSGDVITTASTWLGEQERVSLTTDTDIQTLVANSGPKPKLTAKFEEPLTAPLEAGAVVGELLIEQEGAEPMTVPLVTAEALNKAGFSKRFVQVVSNKFQEMGY